VPFTIVVEDGTGKVGANAYESVADTATRIVNLGFTGFGSLTPDQQTSSVYRGTQRMETELSTALVTGRKVVADQGLAYPRHGSYIDDVIIDTDEVPELVKDCAALAAVEIGQELADGDVEAENPGVKRREASGSEVEYFAGGGSRMSTLSERDAIMSRLVTRPM
jgi:hypothetical protein